jgi:hypothetical protein
MKTVRVAYADLRIRYDPTDDIRVMTVKGVQTYRFIKSNKDLEKYTGVPSILETFQNKNEAFYAYILCLQRLGFDVYKDVRKCIYKYLRIPWYGLMLQNNTNKRASGFTFDMSYSMTIPENSLIRIWNRTGSRCRSFAKQLFVIVDNYEEIVAQVDAFEKIFMDRGYIMDSSVSDYYVGPDGDLVRILAVNCTHDYVQNTLIGLVLPNFKVKHESPEVIHKKIGERYCVRTGIVVSRPTRLKIDGLVRIQTNQNTRKPEYEWRLRGSLRVDPRSGGSLT